MKRFTKLLALLLALLFVLSCGVACQQPSTDSPGDDTPGDDTPGKDEDNKQEPAPVVMVDIVKDGKTNFTVVRSEKSMPKGSDTLTAIRIRLAIEAATSCKIDISDDWEKDEESNNYEILVGRTNRPETALLPEHLEKDEFVILFTGKKILIDAGSDYAFEQAALYFMVTYLGYDEATDSYSKTDLAIPENLDYKSTLEYPPVVYLISGSLKSHGGTGTGTQVENDVVRLITSLQGRLNKNAEENKLYVYWNSDSQDTFWLDYISGEDKMLGGCVRENISKWSEFWEVFGSYIQEAGLVVWDPNVPSTANVAATVCSVDGYLPVCYSKSKGSLYQWLLDHDVPVKLDLTDMFTGKGNIPGTTIPSTGSIKCDPYIWALENYMDRCNPAMIAYVLDGASCIPGNYVYEKGGAPGANDNQLYSHDYYIYNECFFIDLTCVTEEAPCDDPDQSLGTDAATLELILSTMHDRNNGKMIKFMGFPPWYMKYTTHNGMGTILKPTELEWEFVEFISKYNCVKEADAAHPAWMTNASVYCQYETDMEYNNTESDAGEIYNKKVRYFTIYMGDYDSSAWLKQHIPGYFRDPARGDEYPLMWGFNPNLADRVPMIFDYVYENLGIDYIVTGDSGAGYVIPSALPELDTWVEFNMPYMEKFDLDIVGFIINAYNKMTPEIYEAYAEIAPVGSFHNDSSQKLTVLNGETVYMHLMNGIEPVNPDVKDETGRSTFDKMYEYITKTGNNFSAYRTVVKSPSDVINCIEGFIEYANAKDDGYTYMYVDPYTLFDLVLQSGQGTQIWSN